MDCLSQFLFLTSFFEKLESYNFILVISCIFESGFKKNPKMCLNLEDKNEVEANILNMFIFCDGKIRLYTFKGFL